MSELDDSIREQAEQLWMDGRLRGRRDRRRTARHAEALDRRDGERRTFDLEHARERNEREDEVMELCSRFVVWAAEHDIPYNSPSMLARGWLLGRRTAHAHSRFREFVHENRFNGDFAFQHGADPDPRRSLLFNHSGLVGELATYADRMGTDSTARFRPPGPADPADYTLDSIGESIARFSARHDVEWED